MVVVAVLYWYPGPPAFHVMTNPGGPGNFTHKPAASRHPDGGLHQSARRTFASALHVLGGDASRAVRELCTDALQKSVTFFQRQTARCIHQKFKLPIGQTNHALMMPQP